MRQFNCSTFPEQSIHSFGCFVIYKTLLQTKKINSKICIHLFFLVFNIYFKCLHLIILWENINHYIISWKSTTSLEVNCEFNFSIFAYRFNIVLRCISKWHCKYLRNSKHYHRDRHSPYLISNLVDLRLWLFL